MPRSIHYHFSQRFNVPAAKAYKWCTNYSPEDHVLMGTANAKREILNISESTILLIDTYYSKNEIVTKQRLVCLYPNRLSWTSTHFTGPNKYSQFLYEIVPESKETSHLKFTGLQIENSNEESLNKKEVEVLARKLRKEDSATWKLLAGTMEREFMKE
jgi:hypothetical protein